MKPWEKTYMYLQLGRVESGFFRFKFNNANRSPITQSHETVEKSGTCEMPSIHYLDITKNPLKRMITCIHHTHDLINSSLINYWNFHSFNSNAHMIPWPRVGLGRQESWLLNEEMIYSRMLPGPVVGHSHKSLAGLDADEKIFMEKW